MNSSKLTINHGNINKKARVNINGTNYRLVQTLYHDKKHLEAPIQIWQRPKDGEYTYLTDAGAQREVDLMTVDKKRELIRSKVEEILNKVAQAG